MMTSTISHATTTTAEPSAVRSPNHRLEMAWIVGTSADGHLILVARWRAPDHASRALDDAA